VERARGPQILAFALELHKVADDFHDVGSLNNLYSWYHSLIKDIGNDPASVRTTAIQITKDVKGDLEKIKAWAATFEAYNDQEVKIFFQEMFPHWQDRQQAFLLFFFLFFRGGFLYFLTHKLA